MVLGFALLLFCQLAGEVIARGFAFPVPGPVLGLVFMVIGLHMAHRGRPTPADLLEARAVTRVSDGLLANLSLLFVPAGVGVVDQLGVLRTQALAIGAAVVISTALTLVVTVLVFVGVKRLVGPRPGGVRP